MSGTLAISDVTSLLHSLVSAASKRVAEISVETPGVERGQLVRDDGGGCGVPRVRVLLAHARGPSATSTVPCRGTALSVDVGDPIARIIEATAASPRWRDRVQLAKGFAEDVERTLAELDDQALRGQVERCCHVCRTIPCCRLVSVSAEEVTERLRIQEAEAASRKRLVELHSDAFGLAFRFAREGTGAAGAELVLALKECLLACEAVVGDVIAAHRRRRGWDDVATRQEHVSWLRSLRTTLLQEAADVHREAEWTRRANNTRGAGRLFAIKNRFEFVAAALGDLIARSEHRSE